MRKVVAYEGRETPDGRTILPNALVVVEPTIPVLLDRYPASPKLIGTAAEMQRDDAGSISFDIEVEDLSLIKDHTPTIYVSNIVADFEEGSLIQVFEKATIREICYTKGPNAWGETFE